MIEACCNDIIGGEVYITARFRGGTGTQGNFVTYEGIGEIRLQPSKVSRASGATSAGRIWVTEAARPVRAIMTYANRCDADPMRLFMERCDLDITIVEKSRGIWHYMMRAIVSGDVEKNLSTGEISGIEIIADNYRVERRTLSEMTSGILVPAGEGATARLGQL